MKKHPTLSTALSIFTCASALTLAASLPAGASGHPHWGYSGEGGPESWGKLDPGFAICGTGKNQSPIDISGMIEAELTPISFAYQAGGNEILNNGHAVQVNYAPGSSISVDGQTFELKQFHFHSPSENTIDGKFFPMEAHFVHADSQGNLAVVALMFSEGEENAELAKAWSQMPGHADEKYALNTTVDGDKLLPADRDYYRFNGSLTTPPCSEGVRWLVMKEAVTASKEQIDAFIHVMHHPNNRPVQPLNARMILK